MKNHNLGASEASKSLGIALGLAAPTLSMVGFKCRLPGAANFDPGPPSKRNPSQPFALPKFDKFHYIHYINNKFNFIVSIIFY